MNAPGSGGPHGGALPALVLPVGVDSFSVLDSAGPPTPLVVEIPHAGTLFDAESLALTMAPARSVGRDADLLVDRLFRGAPKLGAPTVVAHLSRFVVDLNRQRDEFDGSTVEGGRADQLPRGVLWRTTTEGDPIVVRRLTPAEAERRLAGYYDPYHAAVRRLLDAAHARFGFAILLCAHSMPNRGRGLHSDAGIERADIVPGSRGRTSAAPEVIDALDAEARAAGFTVRHDDPYRGGFSTAHYGKPDTRVHAVQIEIGRHLYMNEDLLRPVDPGFARVTAFADALVLRLAELRLPTS